MHGRFTDLWMLGPSEVIALVGAGGKSALMEALARDYEAEGARVVLTTTTKVRPPGAGGRRLITADNLDELLARLAAESGGAAPTGPLVGRRLLPEQKVEGIPPEWVVALRDAPGVDAVLVEADGSAGRPLKAPAVREPVVPSCATLVIAVAGLDAQGARLDEAHVHRAELVAGLLGVPIGGTVPPQAVLDVLLRGYARHVPPGAGLRVFLNKLDAHPLDPGLAAACAHAPVGVWAGAAAYRAGLRGHGRGEAVGVRCLRGIDARPAAVVLAAGRAARMSGAKLLAPLDGDTVLGRVLEAVRGSRGRLGQVVVVEGMGSEDVSAVAGGFDVVVNPDPAAGQAGSLRVGVGALRSDRDVLVLLGDQPLVTAATLGRVLDARHAARRAAAVGLLVEGGMQVRPPVVLHRSLLPQVLVLRGDQGARELLGRYDRLVVPVVGSAREGLDVDTPAALAHARSLVRGEAAGHD